MSNEEAGQAVASILRRVEADLSLPDRFVLDLVQEDDWSFTIKTHALLEAAVTQALLATITDSRVHDLLSSLNLAGRHSKLAYAKALQILEPIHIGFLDRLSQVRNRIVHSVGEVGFTFSSHLAKLEKGEAHSFVRSLAFMSPSITVQAFTSDATATRLNVWAHAVVILAHCKTHETEAQARAVSERNSRDLAEALSRAQP